MGTYNYYFKCLSNVFHTSITLLTYFSEQEKLSTHLAKAASKLVHLFSWNFCSVTDRHTDRHTHPHTQTNCRENTTHLNFCGSVKKKKKKIKTINTMTTMTSNHNFCNTNKREFYETFLLLKKKKPQRNF